MPVSQFTSQYQRFCTILAEARTSRAISQVSLAERLGKPQSYVSKYENGERRLDIVEFLEIAAALEIDPHDIIDKIKDLREYADRAGNKDLIIQIDGGVTPESIPLMVDAGADALVCGTGTIFRPHEDTISNKVEYIRKIANEL